MAELAEPVVSFLLERISNLLIEEGKFLHGVRDQAEQLQSELKLMRSLLQDADARQHESALVKEWISQSKDLAYEAESVLEGYAFKISLRRRNGVFNFLKRYSCILNECYTHHNFGLEVQNLNDRVSNLTRRFQEYGIKVMTEKEGPSSRRQQLRRTYSHVEEDDFVGLESEVDMLVEQLVNENMIGQFRVVSISGMGGLGKTTIARKVYNHPSIRRQFESFAWVCISQQWQKEEILKGILIKMIPEKREEIEKLRDEELVRKLFDIQQHRRCLIALDDIWSIDAWESIKHAFSTREKGNKILLTTRNKDVAIHIDPHGFHHELRLLNEDESWELLQKKALRGRIEQDSDHIHELEKLGREMVKSCRGLPLAVVVLGGILATKQGTHVWNIVCKNVKSQLVRGSIGQHHGEVQRILALSYDDLPYQLKPCFLYLSMFLEDEEINAGTLCQMWMAEGMVAVEDRLEGESALDVAERYLGELANRCMVQVEAPLVATFERFGSCRLHDLMRELCLLKAREENFSMVMDYRKRGSNDEFANSSKIRGLVVQLGARDVPNYVAPEKEVSMQIRSLRFSISERYTVRLARPIKSLYKNFKMLRSLTIEGLLFYRGKDKQDGLGTVCRALVDNFKLPKAIGKLIHLRYFCLRDSMFITLPSSIGNWQHLETFDLRDSIFFVIPNVLGKLKRLRYLYLPQYPYTTWNPCGVFKLRLSGLSKLEAIFNLRDDVIDAKDLYGLTNLRSLDAIVSKYENAVEIIHYLSNSSKLETVFLEVCAFESSQPEKARTLLRKLLLCGNLHQLELKGPFGKLPEYQPDFFQNLSWLVLDHSLIEDDPMETLEKLPCLSTLTLLKESYIGQQMVCHAMGFPRLKLLLLIGLNNLKKWMVEEGAMPNLRELWINRCKEVEMIPDGLRFLTCLEKVEICNMPEEFNKRLKVVEGEEGEDVNKVCHVPSVTFHVFDEEE